MDMCLLCLQFKDDELISQGIKVTSIQWCEENIEQLIEKHLWKNILKSIASHSWLCTTCWQVLNEFHKFYIRIEDSHARFVSMLKTELLEEKEELTDLSTITKKTLDTQFEVELNIDEVDKPLVIKTEHDNGEHLIASEVKPHPKSRHKSSDPLEKSSPSKNLKIPKDSCKENPEGHTEVNEKFDVNYVAEVVSPPIVNESSSPIDFYNDYKNSSDTDNESDNDETPLEAHWKPRANPYYKPRTKRNDHDEFLAKNFKITCAACQVPMKTFHELCKHFAKCHHDRGYVICCNKKFLRRSILVDHIHRHLDPEYFKCQSCGKVMADRRCLELHNKIHETQEKTHICDICGKAFSRPNALRNHKLIHLSDEEKKFSCDQCGNRFGNKNLLTNHVRVVHLNKYALVCDICGKKMRCKDVFERHILNHKGVPLPTINCEICGLKMTDKRGLKRHKDTQHPEGGKKEYQCHICSKISPTIRAHKRHVQYKHELGYNFKCTICEKAFKRSCSLTEHMATHTGTVLYTCPYCPKTFNSNANMHNHRKKAHPKEWEEACRARYSGNLPPNYKPTAANYVHSTNDISAILR